MIPLPPKISAPKPPKKNLSLLPKSYNNQIIIQMVIYLLSIFLPFLFQLALSTTAYEPIQNFGLLTVTHARGDDYSVLQKYLRRYTETQCYTDLISEINIIWNNEQQPQKTKILQRRKHWKIPVYFFRTTFNSMDHRYRLPKESTAQLLYSLDDDIIVDCQTFKMTLDKYNNANKETILGRVTANQVRGFLYQPNKKMEFKYQGHAGAIYYTIAEPGAAFIPRHFLELYYLALDQIKYLHQIVLDVKNCDDIFFWALVQHFYPELPGVYVKGQKNYKNTDPKVGQSKVKNVYNIRDKCINNISQAFGYNSLRHFHKNSTKYLDNWQYPNLDLILNQKMAGFHSVKSIKAEQKEAPQLTEEEKAWEVTWDKKQPKKIDKKQVEKKLEKKQPSDKKHDQKKKAAQSKQKQKEQKKHLSHPSKPKSNSHQQNSESTEQKMVEIVQQTVSALTFWQKTCILVLVLVFLSVILYKSWQRYYQKSRFYSQQLGQYEQQQQTSSIRLPDHY